ncbi:MAG: hypothetical protein R3D85_08155 [Paracoccaceae bacterium]
MSRCLLSAPRDPIDRNSLDAFGPEKRDFLLQQRDSGRVCFIHTNKCGGTSIETALGIPKVYDTALQRIAKIGRPAWDRMCFATTRHPFARVCSLLPLPAEARRVADRHRRDRARRLIERAFEAPAAASSTTSR